jgi:hypothetical protein
VRDFDILGVPFAFSYGTPTRRHRSQGSAFPAPSDTPGHKKARNDTQRYKKHKKHGQNDQKKRKESKGDGCWTQVLSQTRAIKMIHVMRLKML